jgi:hypothetical protein
VVFGDLGQFKRARVFLGFIGPRCGHFHLFGSC